MQINNFLFSSSPFYNYPESLNHFQFRFPSIDHPSADSVQTAGRKFCKLVTNDRCYKISCRVSQSPRSCWEVNLLFGINIRDIIISHWLTLIECRPGTIHFTESLDTSLLVADPVAVNCVWPSDSSRNQFPSLISWLISSKIDIAFLHLFNTVSSLSYHIFNSNNSRWQSKALLCAPSSLQ